jgi:hypothetical protein
MPKITMKSSEIMERFSAAGCTQSETIVEAEKMKSHILTCLGAILEHNNNGRSFSQDDFLFFKGILSICTVVLKRLSDGKRLFAYPDAPLADCDISIALTHHCVSTFDSFEADLSPLKRACVDEITSPNSLYWAAVVDGVDVDTFDELLKRDIASEALPMDKVSVAHIASATKHNNVQVLEKIKATCPNFAELPDTLGKRALHYAAKYTDSIEMLQYLVEADPSI